jgi:hypothetical protein
VASVFINHGDLICSSRTVVCCTKETMYGTAVFVGERFQGPTNAGFDIFRLLSLFWQNKSLWDHVAGSVCLCIPPIVARQRLGKNPPIVGRQPLGRNVTAVTNTHATVEELLFWRVVFNVARVVSRKAVASWSWVVSSTPWPLYPWYPLDRRLDGFQS